MNNLSPLLQIIIIAAAAVVAHFLVLAFQRVAERWATPEGASTGMLSRRKPKIKTVITIVVSGLTFGIYFAAFGFILLELGVSLEAYFASASLIGLAVAFGTQDMIKDIIIGFTLIFSDVLNIGDIVDMSGQTGRVDKIGMRFTILTNVYEQKVSMPNRLIRDISRYRRGYVRAYVDVQAPEGLSEDELKAIVAPIMQGMHRQHPKIILANPQSMGLRKTEPGDWQYVRYKVKLWPGQGALLETTLKKRIQTALDKVAEGYQDWMIAITYRGE